MNSAYIIAIIATVLAVLAVIAGDIARNWGDDTGTGVALLIASAVLAIAAMIFAGFGLDIQYYQ